MNATVSKKSPLDSFKLQYEEIQAKKIDGMYIAQLANHSFKKSILYRYIKNMVEVVSK